MLHQTINKQGKLVYLYKAWNKEKFELKHQLVKESSKQSRELFSKVCRINEQVSRQLLLLYLERCMFKYNLAFFQWRGSRPGGNAKTVEKIFNERLLILIDSLRQANIEGGSLNKDFKKFKTLVSMQMNTKKTKENYLETEESSEEEYII